MPASEEQKLTHPAQSLLVEDNRMDAELTLDVFRQARLTNAVHVARPGVEALDYLLGRGEFANRERHPLPDLVLLHLKTPLASGNQVLREIKSRPRLARIPVVILTSSKAEGERALGSDFGADSYLVKPIAFGDLLAMAGQIEDYSLTLNVHPRLDTSALDMLSSRDRQFRRLLAR